MQLAPPGATLARSEAQLRAEEYEATVEIAALQVRAIIRRANSAEICAQFSDRHVIAAQSKLSELAPRVETALGAKLAWHAVVGAEKAAKALNAVSHAELHQHLISAEGTSRAYAAQFWRNSGAIRRNYSHKASPLLQVRADAARARRPNW